MEKLLNIFFKFIETMCKLMLILQIICVTIVVVGRYGFSKTPPWGEELTLVCLVWIALLSAAISVREGRHMRVTVIEHFFSKKGLKILDILSLMALMFFAVILVIHGIKLAQLTYMRILPGLRIKSSWLYASVPISSFVLIIAVLERGYYLLTNKEGNKCL